MEKLSSGVENGIEWFTSPAGNWVNGYVRVPEGHPWYKMATRLPSYKGYGEIDKIVGEKGLGGNLIGGAQELTYSNEDGWIGFDTAHYYDYWPGDFWHARIEVSWTPEDVVEQTKEWARIVANAGEVLSTTVDMYLFLVAFEVIISRAEKDPEWNPRENIIDVKEGVTALQESLRGQMSADEKIETLRCLLATVKSD